MANLKDVRPNDGFRIMALGGAGAGKTTAFSTLIGRKFIYVFDPNAIPSLAGSDIDFELFQPDIGSFALSSLKASGRSDKPTRKDQGSEAFLGFERHFEASIESGSLLQYDWVGLDSISTLADMIMDRVLTLNGRSGQHPQQDDYAPAMVSLRNIIRMFSSLQRPDGSFVNIYVTGHLELNKDELSGRVFTSPMLMGKLRQKLPILFTDLLIMEADTDSNKKVKFSSQTTPTKLNPMGRTSLRSSVAEPVWDLTIDWTKPREGQGLGKYFKISPLK